jgi:predicted ArsR family transcriptional regulator
VQKTRRVILDFLKQRSRATLDELAQEAGLASMSVRGHLSILERDGLISYEEERGKVGRPRFVYYLTERGNDLFPKVYHVLCNRVLDVITNSSANAASELASLIADGWANEHAHRLAGKSLEEQVKTLAAIRTEEGAMACFEKTEDGFLVCQHHCPASCVAARHPQVICAAEIGFMKRLLNASVERVSWALNGDSTCTYRIRPRSTPVTDSATPRETANTAGELPPPCRPAPAD